MLSQFTLIYSCLIPQGFQSCAIICRMSKGTPQTPTLYLTNEGKLVLGGQYYSAESLLLPGSG